MQYYDFYDALIITKNGKQIRCLIKVAMGVKTFLKDAIISAYDLSECCEFCIQPDDEVRWMGNGPITGNQRKWHKGAVITRIKKQRKREIATTKKFFRPF